jgi:hypothetical protein
MCSFYCYEEANN